MDICNYGLFAVSISFEIWSRILVADNIDTVNALHAESVANAAAALSAVNASASAADDQFYGAHNFVAFYEPGYLSGIAYTFLGVNAVVTWLKTLKYRSRWLSPLPVSLSVPAAEYRFVRSWRW